MPLIPFFVSVAVISTGAWVLNKVISTVTGRTIDENLDAAADKVISFVRPQSEINQIETTNDVDA